MRIILKLFGVLVALVSFLVHFWTNKKKSHHVFFFLQWHVTIHFSPDIHMPLPFFFLLENICTTNTYVCCWCCLGTAAWSSLRDSRYLFLFWWDVIPNCNESRSSSIFCNSCNAWSWISALADGVADAKLLLIVLVVETMSPSSSNDTDCINCIKIEDMKKMNIT